MLDTATGAHLFVSYARSADGPPKAWYGLIGVDSYTTSNMLSFFLMETCFFIEKGERGSPVRHNLTDCAGFSINYYRLLFIQLIIGKVRALPGL